MSFVYGQHATKIMEFKIDENTQVVLDSDSTMHFWQNAIDGWKKTCIIVLVNEKSDSPYDFCLYAVNVLNKGKRLASIYRDRNVRGLAYELKYTYAIEPTEEIWEALDAARLMREMKS